MKGLHVFIAQHACDRDLLAEHYVRDKFLSPVATLWGINSVLPNFVLAASMGYVEVE